MGTLGRLLTGLAALAIVVVVAVLVLQPLSERGEPVSVLFVGNSYTMSNDLAGAFSAIASAGGYDVETETVAWGGAWLRDHVERGNAETAMIGAKWDFVVLQEQSVVPASSRYRSSAMYPAVRRLVSMAEIWSTEPVLFLTWARRGGFPDVGYSSYGPMQAAITSAYEEIADEVGARVGPRGRGVVRDQELGSSALPGRWQPPITCGYVPGRRRVVRHHLRRGSRGDEP